MTTNVEPGPPARTSKWRAAVRRVMEFKDVRQQSLQRYREQVHDHYSGTAGAFLHVASLVSLHEPLLGRFLRQGKFDITRFESILDVGAGAGQIMRHLLKLVPASTRLVACDLSHNMLRRAKKRLASTRPTYVAGDMTNLPFADQAFDCITCGFVLEHLPDPTPALQEFFRVLRPGGSVLLLVTEDTYQGFLTSRTWKCRTFSRTELKDACESCGLSWHEVFWFTRVHKMFKAGGILVDVRRPM